MIDLNIKAIKKRREKEKKTERKKKKENATELKMPNIEADVFNNKKCDWIYKYTHKQNKNSPTKIKYNRLIQWTKETKNYIYQLRTKRTRGQTRKQD